MVFELCLALPGSWRDRDANGCTRGNRRSERFQLGRRFATGREVSPILSVGQKATLSLAWHLSTFGRSSWRPSFARYPPRTLGWGIRRSTACVPRAYFVSRGIPGPGPGRAPSASGTLAGPRYSAGVPIPQLRYRCTPRISVMLVRVISALSPRDR